MIKYYITTLTIAFLISFGLTPVIRRLSLKMKWLDYPGRRRINKKPMPRGGGIAIYAGFVAALLVFALSNKMMIDKYKFYGLLGGSFIIALVGLLDDVIGLTPRRKLFYQVCAAMVAYISGYSIIKVSTPLGGALHAPALISMLLTVFWIVGFTNAINLLDGLDGLAAGVVAIIAGSLFFAALKSGYSVLAVLALALCASALGFLPYNFYPAKIFMGDVGSMFLGFTIALITIEGTLKGATAVTFFVPVVAVGVPVIDTGLAILRRLIRGKEVFKPDKEHIHHQLLSQEGSQREAVVKLYFITICFGSIAIGLSGMKGTWAFFGIILTALATLRMVMKFDFLNFMNMNKEK